MLWPVDTWGKSAKEIASRKISFTIISKAPISTAFPPFSKLLLVLNLDNMTGIVRAWSQTIDEITLRIVRMWELNHKEGWVLKNWCFRSVVLEKTPERSLDCKIKPVNSKKTKQNKKSILKEISPEYSLEGLTLKLKLQYFGHLMWRTDSLEKTLMLRKIEAGKGDDRGWDVWMASSTQWTWV